MNEIKCVILNDNIEIRLNDKDDIFISFVSGKKTLNSLPISYPSAGYADGSLYLSPDKSYLLFSYYSGQSEEAFTLFRIIDNNLKTIFASPYLGGEVADYAFSPDEKLLIQSLPSMCSEWWQPWLDNDVLKDKDGKLFFDFGAINILDIEKQTIRKHILRIYPTDDWCPQEISYSPFMSPKITNSDTLKISMPWGDETIDFPLKDIIVFHI